jgi:carbohydrate kinase (thermoresistant glucokinase family)
MGVAGSGKSSFGSALARAMKLEFVDGDDLHPASNVAKMRGGQALDDEDRAPWLHAVAAVLADEATYPDGAVVACSSLKRAYRDELRRLGDVRFVFLDADLSLIERRFAQRSHHFMPGELIASQFDVLEPPTSAEGDVLTIDAAAPLERAVGSAVGFFAEQSILRSWRMNAVAWSRAVREQSIASRKLITDRAIIDTVLSLSVRRVLDIGCGEGWLARALGRAGMAVTGVDATDSLIAAANWLGGGTFEVQSYADLADGRFEPRDFEAAVCNFSLSGDESVERLCGASRQYMVPPAYLVIQTLHPVVACGNHPYSDGWRAGSWSGFGPEFSDAAPWYFRTQGSWLALLWRAGFELVDYREPTFPGAHLPSSLILVARAHDFPRRSRR